MFRRLYDKILFESAGTHPGKICDCIPGPELSVKAQVPGEQEFHFFRGGGPVFPLRDLDGSGPHEQVAFHRWIEAPSLGIGFYPQPGQGQHALLGSPQGLVDNGNGALAAMDGKEMVVGIGGDFIGPDPGGVDHCPRPDQPLVSPDSYNPALLHCKAQRRRVQVHCRSVFHCIFSIGHRDFIGGHHPR